MAKDSCTIKEKDIQELISFTKRPKSRVLIQSFLDRHLSPPQQRTISTSGFFTDRKISQRFFVNSTVDTYKRFDTESTSINVGRNATNVASVSQSRSKSIVINKPHIADFPDN